MLPREIERIISRASYPPFENTSANAARELLWGEHEDLVELLSINGHVVLSVERIDTGSAVVRLYWSAAPLERGAENEWRLATSRLFSVLQRLDETETVEYGELHDGWSEATVGPVDDAGRLSQIIGLARSIAGVRPYTGLPHVGVLPIPPSPKDLDNLVSAGLGMESIIEWLDNSEELIVKLVENDLFYEAQPPKGTAEIVGNVTPRHVRNLYGTLKSLGVIRACKRSGRVKYFVDMRNEIVLSYILHVSAGLRLPCALLPLVEGVSHRDWVVFPGPYRTCKDVVKELSNVELNWGNPPC